MVCSRSLCFFRNRIRSRFCELLVTFAFFYIILSNNNCYKFCPYLKVKPVSNILLNDFLFGAVSSLVGIISVINQYIVDTAPAECIADPQEPSSFPYSLCIFVVKEIETLVEVIAEHYHGDDNKWNFIAVTEGIK